MPRAFFKTVAGKKRWRIVTAGKNADDLGLDPNFVVFDSEFTNTLSVYSSGVFSLASAPVEPVGGAKILGWPALPYTPLTLFNGTGPDSGTSFDQVMGSASSGPLAVISVKPDGLYMLSVAYFNYPCTFWYVAFRAPV